MNLLHLADLHLGKRVNGFDLLPDQRYILEQVLDLCTAHNVQAVALAGDIYDTALPPAAAVLLLDWFLTELAHRNIPVLAIAGNHDSAERLAVASRLLKWQGLYIFGPLTRLSPVILEDADGKVAFCPLPYAEPARVRVMMNTLGLEGADQVHSYEEAETVLSRYLLSLLPSEPLQKVALAHAFAAGGTPSESERPLSIGGYDRISDSVFEEYDYTALGHLHRPQKTQRESEKIQYSGSLMRYSFDEVNQKKGVIVGELDKEGKVHTTFHEMVPRYQVRCMEGTFDTLMGEETEPSDDYLQIRLTDETPVIDAMPKLRTKFPHALGVEQDMGYREDEGSRNIRLEQMSDEDILKRFVHQFRDRDLTEEEEKLALQTWDTVYRKENAQ